MELINSILLSITKIQPKLKSYTKSFYLKLDWKNDPLTVEKLVRCQTSGGFPCSVVVSHDFKKLRNPVSFMKGNGLGKNVLELSVGDFNLFVGLWMVR